MVEYQEELYKAKKYHTTVCEANEDFVFLEVEKLGEQSFCQCVECGCIFCFSRNDFGKYHVVPMEQAKVSMEEKLDTMYQIRALLKELKETDMAPKQRVKRFFHQYGNREKRGE